MKPGRKSTVTHVLRDNVRVVVTTRPCTDPDCVICAKMSKYPNFKHNVQNEAVRDAED